MANNMPRGVTVRDWMEILSQLPPDAVVVETTGDHELTPISPIGVRIAEVDANNPQMMWEYFNDESMTRGNGKALVVITEWGGTTWKPDSLLKFYSIK